MNPQNAGWCNMWQLQMNFSPHPRYFPQNVMDLRCCFKESWLYWALEHERAFIMIIFMLLLYTVCRAQAPDVKFYQHNVSLIKYYICNTINNMPVAITLLRNYHNFGIIG